jgi:hypothetical protein
MEKRSDFWDSVNRLANDLAQEGVNDVGRAENLTAVLESFPKEKRTACLANLAEVAGSLPIILTLCQKREGESG